MKNPLIIGAGGVASYLLPVYLKAFKPESLTIIDKDKLEERNLDRQMFAPGQVGENKAPALASLLSTQAISPPKITTIYGWFTETTTIPEHVDCIICIADNHVARAAALKAADREGLPCFIGGNEYYDSQAYYYTSEWKGTLRDPRIRYPEILTSRAGSPISCQGEEQEIHPQLAIANFSCASKLLCLIHVWMVWHRENPGISPAALDCLPYELVTTLTENSANPHSV